MASHPDDRGDADVAHAGGVLGHPAVRWQWRAGDGSRDLRRRPRVRVVAARFARMTRSRPSRWPACRSMSPRKRRSAWCWDCSRASASGRCMPPAPSSSIRPGLAFATTIDPLTGQDDSLLGSLLVRLFTTLFLVTGGLLSLISMLFDSYTVWPLSSLTPAGRNPLLVELLLRALVAAAGHGAQGRGAVRDPDADDRDGVRHAVALRAACSMCSSWCCR